MTAVRAFTVETKADKLERLSKEWVQTAAGYMFAIGLYSGVDPQEISQAYELAESLFEGSKNIEEANLDNWITPKESVDEELTYWGD
ncbi:hypothetical protein QGX11_gp126 [Pseudomonas phage PPSC2]|uniref:Uncharacterized protein n=1 Tax=Pseudomonas phage PPSC2 TaxID=2041350 RepID=A0A2R2YB69_9CAUD|nr:hypothetical protein QGX11_gp126 [Pseudomonas phage PPSC2]ATN92889.1 hypothetical protein PPSC2_126 [Pseudomonas phage PPSC2]